MYKICFFVPDDHVDSVKSAMFDAGAGRIGNYDHCSWQTLGSGQFRPLDGSSPTIGSIGDIEHVPEYKVECVCDDEYIESVIEAMRSAHPYEEPAYDVIKLEAF